MVQKNTTKVDIYYADGSRDTYQLKEPPLNKPDQIDGLWVIKRGVYINLKEVKKIIIKDLSK